MTIEPELVPTLSIIFAYVIFVWSNIQVGLLYLLTRSKQ